MKSVATLTDLALYIYIYILVLYGERMELTSLIDVLQTYAHYYWKFLLL